MRSYDNARWLASKHMRDVVGDEQPRNALQVGNLDRDSGQTGQSKWRRTDLRIKACKGRRRNDPQSDVPRLDLGNAFAGALGRNTVQRLEIRNGGCELLRKAH